MNFLMKYIAGKTSDTQTYNMYRLGGFKKSGPPCQRLAPALLRACQRIMRKMGTNILFSFNSDFF